MRRVACSCGICKPLGPDERTQLLTSSATRKLGLLAKWDWGRVLTYAFWLCFVCWLMIFFSKMTRAARHCPPQSPLRAPLS